MPALVMDASRMCSRNDQNNRRSQLLIYTTWGVIRVMASHGRVFACRLPRLRREMKQPFRWCRSMLCAREVHDRGALLQARRYLRRILQGKQAFPPLLAPFSGSPFMRRVWCKLAKIPWGKRMTYGDLAAEIGFGSRSIAARAVGRACHANPLPLFIPCHRVVQADGRLGGFSSGAVWKRYLLELEGFKGEGAPSGQPGAKKKRKRIR